MSSTAPSSSTPINANTKSASPANASGTTSSNARFSYASATKGQQASPSASALTDAPAVVGGLALSQHAHKPSDSTVNGRPTAPPTAPTGPAIVSSTNGAPGHREHSRAPSVTITAQGVNGAVTNGFGTPARPPINFGSIGASPSPSMSHSTPHMHHNSLSSHYGGPNPARSPSPIPPPAVSSGGRPPSSLAGQNPVSFGSLPDANGSDQSLPLRPGVPSGPSSGPQAQHLRRESSQSAHSDNNLNRNFTPNGRGAGNRAHFNGQQFPNAQAAHSPSMFRPNLAMQNRTPSNVPPFQRQVPGGTNSPYQATRSPAMGPHAQPHMPNIPNGGPMAQQYGYPPHMHQGPMYMPQEGYYGQYPSYQQPGFMPPNMFQPPHQPMSPAPPAAFRAQPPYASGPYQSSPGPQSMSRQASQSGDQRPSSSMGHSPGPQGPQASPSPGPAPTVYQRPPKKSSAIRITNADGQVVDFKKSVQSPVTATPNKGPAVISSGGPAPASSTPPRTVTPSAQEHARAPSMQVKSAEERKREFQEAFQKQLEAEKLAQQEKDKPAEVVVPEVTPTPVEAKVEEAKEPEKVEELEAPAVSGETEEERKKREEDEEMEREIAEMEAAAIEEERLEAEREAAYQLKKKAKQEEEKRQAAEREANEEEEMKKLEREAEEREEAKSKGQTGNDSDAEAADLFSKLKKNTMFGPGASGTPASETSTPGSESPMPPPAQPASAAKAATLPTKNKPAALKLETTKAVEPAQPTAGMQALKTARFLEVKNDDLKYPEGIKSPNPALNSTNKAAGKRYDNDFLLQFREVFKEKPSTDWDKTIKDTVGDGTDSARPGSARTPSMGGRSMSGRPGAQPMGGAMGSFVGARPLPAGTTSEQRFQASNLGPSAGRPGMPFPGGSFPAGRGNPFPMGAPGMARTPSAQNMSGMNSPRNPSHRGKGSRRGGPNYAQEAEAAKKMPLTAGMNLAPLEVSQTGWKPTNIGAPVQGAALPSGHLAPDMVQRKVKAALNKMTPEKFDKISGDILLIASQSKDESDGRTLRQVIQLTFEKACDEAHWSSMYAKFCERMLQDMGPEIRDEGVKDKHGAVVVGGALFRKYLLNRCQEEFERGWEVNLPEKPEGAEEVMLSDDYYVAAAAKRKGLGLIQFIGELYKLGMLTLRIMHECVVKLLNFEGTPDEAAIESLIKLLRTIGGTMDNDPTGKGRSMMDTYIDRIQTIMKIEGLPSRMYYMLLDTTEMRKKNWQSKDVLKGPKTIQEIHDEATAAAHAADIERQRSSRGGGHGGRIPQGRGDARSFSGGGMPPPDYKSSSVAMDDLKKLTRNARTTPSGSGLGPGSLLSNSRSGSRRGGLGPKMGDDSGNTSRTNTPPVKDSTASANAYSALAALEGDHPDDIASPPSQHASPAITKADPAGAESK